MEFEIAYWHWIVLAFALGAIELMVFSFVILGFAIGALTVGLILLVIPDISLAMQIVIWTADSIIFNVAWFKFIKPLSIDKTKADLAKESVVGETGHVVKIPTDGKKGVVRFTVPLLGDDEWSFIWADESTTSPGEKIRVIDISGNTLVVKPNQPQR